MTNEIKEKLFNCATDFYIDPFIDLFITSCGNGNWKLKSGSEVLNKDGEWQYEPMPSNREKDFISQTRFNSINDALDFYLKWRGERYFVISRGTGDSRWHCFCSSKEIKECEKCFDALSINNRVRLFLIGKNREIIKDIIVPGSESIEFKDIF